MNPKTVLFGSGILVLLLGSNFAHSFSEKEKVVYKRINGMELASLNRNLKECLPSVDLSIYLAEKTAQPHRYVQFPEELLKSLETSREIFASAGVQLKIRSIKRSRVPPSPPSTTLISPTGRRSGLFQNRLSVSLKGSLKRNLSTTEPFTWCFCRR